MKGKRDMSRIKSTLVIRGLGQAWAQGHSASVAKALPALQKAHQVWGWERKEAESQFSDSVMTAFGALKLQELLMNVQC